MNSKKIEIIPYLSFNGDCEEAVRTYIKVFGGEIRCMSRWSESAYEVKPEQREKVMHVEFSLGTVLMAAGDNVDYMETEDIRLMVYLGSGEEVLRAVALLGEGGTILSPPHQHQMSDDTGSEAVLTDCFGVTWIIRCPNIVKRG